MDDELKTYLASMEARIVDILTEKMRDMQSELLRGFSAFSHGQSLRLRKVEADQSNLDAALSGRVNVLEERLRQIELRLGLAS
jgi:hypothetical protein